MKSIERIALASALATLAIVSVMLCERIDQAEGYLFDACITDAFKVTLNANDCRNHTAAPWSFQGRVYSAMRAFRREAR